MNMDMVAFNVQVVLSAFSKDKSKEYMFLYGFFAIWTLFPPSTMNGGHEEANKEYMQVIDSSLWDC